MDELTIAHAAGSLSALWQRPRRARAALVLAHGAGAGMRHPFLAGLADALAARGVATLRYQFPYLEAGTRRVDPPPVAHAAVRAAVAFARRRARGLPLLAGGKSFGGRMTTQADALAPLGVGGLVLVGFPLHPAERPSVERAAHLPDVAAPTLFLQGTRDALADLALLRPVLARLPRATLHIVDGADHGFAVRGRKPADVLAELADRIRAFADAPGGEDVSRPRS